MASSPFHRAQQRHAGDPPDGEFEAQSYHVIAEAGPGGPGLMTGLLNRQRAIARAVELVDAGYQRVVLRDAATREELTFDPPWPRPPNRRIH